MAYRFLETEEWDRSRLLLGRNAKVSLPHALDRIQADPHDTFRRMKRFDGATVDYGADGLLIAYEVLEPDRIRLLTVADVHKEHHW